jgi:hypothetical protein
MQISQFTFKDTDVDLTYLNGWIAYTFEKNGKTYGGKVKVETKKHMDIISYAFNLALNLLETYEALNNENK